MAERQGFEPWRRFPAYTRSRRAPSTTRPPLRYRASYSRVRDAFKSIAGRLGDALPRIALICLPVLLAVTPARADVLTGLFSSPDSGNGYIHIRFLACQSNEELTCGVIATAFDTEGQEQPDYENIGKFLVWDMEYQGQGEYADGYIWHPIKDKIYRAKLKLISDNEVKATGCLSIFCQSEQWLRIE